MILSEPVARFAFFVILAGLSLSAVLLAAVFFSEMTFGQRCSNAGHEGQPFNDCVQRLSAGGDA